MRCEHVRESVLELLDGALAPEDRDAVQKHLAGCEACRGEFEALKRGHDGLTASLEALAPTEKYLTDRRLDQLLDAFAVRAQRPHIVTLRRFVAAAAAAVILVSSFAIYRSARSMLAEPETTRIAQDPAVTVPPGWAGMVAVTLPSDERRLNIVFRYMKASATDAAAVRPVHPANLIRTTSQNVYVPVRSAFYDGEEAARWW